ncbi:MAG TPA: electron transfer flavoprotein subunit alpha/FixB family protein [Candidatus Dormibacteraeota bacterium]|jgi:electron transfer flavoprotein alpha subunit
MALGTTWVFAEIVDGAPVPAVLELLTKARSLGGTTEAVALSPQAEAAAAVLGEYGATTLHAGTDAAYGELLPGGPAADAIAALADQHHPDLILIAATYLGRDVAGRLAAKLDVPVVANGLDVVANGTVSVQSSIFGATQDVTTVFEAKRPAIALIRPKSFAAESAGGGPATVTPVAGEIAEQHRSVRVVERRAEAASGPKLEEAPIVISGGRGLGDPKNFELLEQLAALVGGAVGASRAVVDAGWVPYSMQVGQTGKTVKPAVYIACGISGAMQHTVGMKGATTIIAINRDADAPIFKLADLGVVGDALKILPQVIEEIKARRG